jgi:acyl carrier protein
MNLVRAFEKHFNATIPTRDVWQLKKVYNVVDYLKKKDLRSPDGI